MKINLGSGNHPLTGYVNVDIDAQHGPEIVGDMRRVGRLFHHDSAAEIKAIHAIEHLYPHDVVRCLVGCWDVLKDGGNLVLIGPDVLQCYKHYIEDKQDAEAFVFAVWGYTGLLYGTPWYHLSGWTCETLAAVVARLGFDLTHVGHIERRVNSGEIVKDRDFLVTATKDGARRPTEIRLGHKDFGYAQINLEGDWRCEHGEKQRADAVAAAR